ncbi:cytochrome-c peroxidase [Aquimarina agarivorans]|uniref:cytochrome-c peroxidase n=1 Tax=Aquimarina agarivorans TaxID=980584 RepID=UPI000248EC1B|nr:cytochrome c peroxidase [Aquimarina agarivorans]
MPLIIISTLSCEDESVENNDIYISFEKPSNFPELTYDFSENEFTQQKFELGKRLFYDGKLSSDGSVSCGSCHNQSNAFTHHGHDISDGVNGVFGTRNTQPLQNLAFMKDFTWDGAIRHLDLQPIIPIESEVEMNETIDNVLLKLQNDVSYVTQFNESFEKKSFEPHIISLRTLTQSLSQFMNALVSANSRYDKYVRGEVMEIPYSEEEKEGLSIFNNKCAQCHSGDLFTDQTYRNNGLALSSKFPDELGRGRVTGEDLGGNAPDYYKFKVPSLRNIWVTFPYMHDGRLATIDDVLDHYDTGVQDTPNLDPILKQNEILGISLSNEDKRLLKFFLKSLTDNTFITDERFAED